MKIILLVLGAVLIGGLGLALFLMRGALATGVQHPDVPTTGSLWQQKTKTLAGTPTTLTAWQGQVALVVNVASKCGLTPQYEGLEELYTELADRGFVILAFPSNDFMGQEPGTATEIRSFCETNFQVTFPLFEKVRVKGDQRCDIYRFVTAGGLAEPSWNFTKYLVNREGEVIARFGPRTKPDDPQLRQAILATLGD